MSLYHRARKEEGVFLSLTGLLFSEFDEVLPFFQTAWEEAIETAGAAEKYRCSFYPGGHKFDLEMQAEAFDWWDRWLKDG